MEADLNFQFAFEMVEWSFKKSMKGYDLQSNRKGYDR